MPMSRRTSTSISPRLNWSGNRRDTTMQVKTWAKRQPPSLEGKALTWLLKILSFVGLALVLSVAILLLTGCARPCHPDLDLTRLLKSTPMAGAIGSVGLICEWRY